MTFPPNNIHEEPDHVEQAFLEFAFAGDRAAARTGLELHQELLSTLADPIIDELRRRTAERGTPDELDRVTVRFAMLRRCRETGLDAAFAEAVEFAELSQTLFDALGGNNQPRTQTDLATAVGAARRIALHPRQDSVLRASRLRLLNAVATALIYGYNASHLVADLDLAAAAIDDALRSSLPDTPERAAALANHAWEHSRRYYLTGNIGLLSPLVGALDESIALTLLEVPDLAGRLNNRANGRSSRYERTRDPADLAAALEDIRTALALTPVDSPSLARRLNNGCRLLYWQYELTGDVGDLETAIALGDRAVAGTGPASLDRPARLHNRANVLFARYEGRHDPADLEAAIRDIDEAIRLGPPASPSWPGFLANQAAYHASRHALVGTDADRAVAVASYRQACTEGLTRSPHDAQTAASGWSLWGTARRAWYEVVEAGALGQAAPDELVRVQVVRDAKESRLRDVQGLAARTAYAAARLGDGRGSVLAAERGRAVLLAEAVTSRKALADLRAAGHAELAEVYEAAAQLAAVDQSMDPSQSVPVVAAKAARPVGASLDAAIAAIQACPGFGSFLKRRPDERIFDEVVATASVQPLLYLVPGLDGGFGLLVGGSGTVEVLDLPGLEAARLADIVDRYVDALEVDPDAWVAVLDETCAWLGTVLCLALERALSAIGTAQVTLIPLGRLGLLPLHAAWVPNRQAAGGRDYLLDRLTIAYAPNGQARAVPPASSAVHEASILAVARPELPGSEPEVVAASSWFPGRSTILRNDAATSERVLRAMPGSSVIHLSCHGRALPLDPLESYVLMALGQRITLADLLAHELEGTRLVVLSACESAVPGRRLLDEVVSLPTGILQAGAAAVIGSLWSVDDLATMVLMTRFYQLWRGDGLPLDDALQGAQRWVRDLSRPVRDAAFPNDDFTASGDKGEYPYRHPYWWAAFALTGV